MTKTGIKYTGQILTECPDCKGTNLGLEFYVRRWPGRWVRSRDERFDRICNVCLDCKMPVGEYAIKTRLE